MIQFFRYTSADEQKFTWGCLRFSQIISLSEILNQATYKTQW